MIKVKLEVTWVINGKHGEVTVRSNHAPKGSRISGSPLYKELFKLIGIIDCFTTGSDNSFGSIRVPAEAVRKKRIFQGVKHFMNLQFHRDE